MHLGFLVNEPGLMNCLTFQTKLSSIMKANYFISIKIASLFLLTLELNFRPGRAHYVSLEKRSGTYGKLTQDEPNSLTRFNVFRNKQVEFSALRRERNTDYSDIIKNFIRSSALAINNLAITSSGKVKILFEDSSRFIKQSDELNAFESLVLNSSKEVSSIARSDTVKAKQVAEKSAVEIKGRIKMMNNNVKTLTGTFKSIVEDYINLCTENIETFLKSSIKKLQRLVPSCSKDICDLKKKCTERLKQNTQSVINIVKSLAKFIMKEFSFLENSWFEGIDTLEKISVKRFKELATLTDKGEAFFLRSYKYMKEVEEKFPKKVKILIAILISIENKLKILITNRIRTLTLSNTGSDSELFQDA